MVEEVDIYLVAVGDNGKKGLKIGCDDSLVRVPRKIKPTVAPLRAAIEELLAAPHEYSKELGNYWWGKDLKLKNVSITDGVATIHISGEGPFVAGVCDEPRITEQIENTAMQFSSVNVVKVFVNDKPLADAIR
jgi:spore germination protein GerM